MAKILIADDDGHIREVLHYALTEAGHQVVEACDGDQAVQLATSQAFDLIILDVVMPGRDGLAVCTELRRTLQTPVIFLSSRDEEIDRILGLELGADDYVSKPFSPRELVTRVKVILRRAAPSTNPQAAPATALPEPTSVRWGALCLDPSQHRCTLNGAEISLTATEFALLMAMLRAPGRVFSRGQLMELGYGDGHIVSDRTVDSHVRRIRQKLAQHGAKPIETVFGVGYRCAGPPD